MSFTSFNFDPRVAAGIDACGYGTPTPIQEKAIPPVMDNRDVMGLAQTGTGKTAAFALPILDRLVKGPRGVLRALILAPTRELAEQIRGSIHTLGGKTKLRAIAVYGGVGIGQQIQSLRRGADIVVACPGRLLDHIQQRTIDLRRIEVLVLDEADMMLDMGFLPDIRRILKHLPIQRQNLMFSATMPEAIRELSSDILSKPVTVQISRQAPAETVSHAIYPVQHHLKTPLLIELLGKTGMESVLVFTRTKQRAKRLGQYLTEKGYKAASLQGNLSQNARQAALAGFRDGKYKILVATDIAARGIDVSQVSHVINFDIPSTPDAYTHRIGRTGRALRTGDAFTLVSQEDESMVREIERVLKARIERRTIEGFNYSQASAPAGGTGGRRAQRARHASAKEQYGRRPGQGQDDRRPRQPQRHSSSRDGGPAQGQQRNHPRAGGASPERRSYSEAGSARPDSYRSQPGDRSARPEQHRSYSNSGDSRQEQPQVFSAARAKPESGGYRKPASRGYGNDRRPKSGGSQQSSEAPRRFFDGRRPRRRPETEPAS